MDKVYQVFVSSTFTDLQQERSRVSEALSKAGFMPAGMELFPASSMEQFEFIKRVIDRSDYYVVIVGGRYGSLADDGVSYTEKEFEYALGKGIPVLGFPHFDPLRLAVGKSDIDADQKAKLEAFLARLKKGRVIDVWNDASDLAGKVIIAVTQEVNLNPGIGWVRGDQAVDPKILQDMERLRIENAELKKRLADTAEREITFPLNLAGPEAEILLDVTADRTVAHQYPRIALGSQVFSVCVELGALFIAIFELLIMTPEEWTLRKAIGKAALELGGQSPPFEANTEVEVTASSDQIVQLRFHLEALGLIEAVGIRSASHEALAWAITDKGRRYATRSRAIKAPGVI